MAAESESLRRRLLASIARDLKKPIEKIKDASASLEADTGVSEGRRIELARSIGAHADQLADVVSNSLELVRLEAGAVALRVEPRAIGVLVSTVLERLRQPLAAHAVTVRLPSDLPTVRVDGPLIEEVFENLLKNAARYTPAGTAVTIDGRADSNWLYVTVEDDGPGLPETDCRDAGILAL